MAKKPTFKNEELIEEWEEEQNGLTYKKFKFKKKNGKLHIHSQLKPGQEIPKSPQEIKKEEYAKLKNLSDKIDFIAKKLGLK